MWPSDSQTLSASAPVPLAFGLPRCSTLFASTPCSALLAHETALREIGHRLSRNRLICRGGVWASQFAGYPFATCHGRTSRRERVRHLPWGALSAPPLSGDHAAVFGQPNTLDSRNRPFRDCYIRGPQTSLAYASPVLLLPPAQG